MISENIHSHPHRHSVMLAVGRFIFMWVSVSFACVIFYKTTANISLSGELTKSLTSFTLFIKYSRCKSVRDYKKWALPSHCTAIEWLQKLKIVFVWCVLVHYFIHIYLLRFVCIAFHFLPSNFCRIHHFYPFIQSKLSKFRISVKYTFLMIQNFNAALLYTQFVSMERYWHCFIYPSRFFFSLFHIRW